MDTTITTIRPLKFHGPGLRIYEGPYEYTIWMPWSGPKTEWRSGCWTTGYARTEHSAAAHINGDDLAEDFVRGTFDEVLQVLPPWLADRARTWIAEEGLAG